MGTLTAIGEPRDPRRGTSNHWGTTTATSLTTIVGTRASIGLDSWEAAIDAAMVAARTSRNVKVNKVADEWVVSWDAPVIYNPSYPTLPQPYWQNPWTVTWSSDAGESA